MGYGSASETPDSDNSSLDDDDDIDSDDERFKTDNSQTCLNRTPLGLKNLFSLDRCLVYTGSNYIDI
jgi:hypothetical protein